MSNDQIFSEDSLESFLNIPPDFAFTMFQGYGDFWGDFGDLEDITKQDAIKRLEDFLDQVLKVQDLEIVEVAA